MKNSKKIMLFIIFFLFLFPLITKADIITPTAGEKFKAYLVVFVANLIVNFFIFGLAYLIFFRKEVKIFKPRKFFLSLIMVTIWGFIADIIIFSKVYRVEIWHFVCLFLLISIVDALICKFYLKANLRKSVYIGLWMGILSNPIIFYFAIDIFYSPIELFKNIF